MGGIIGFIVEFVTGIIGNLIANPIQQKLDGMKKKKAGEELFGLFSAKAAANDPTIIMGNARGSIQNGYRKDVYKTRFDIDIPLQQAILAEKRTHNICILSGRYASGKSRSIQQLIVNNDGKNIKKVFKPDFKGTPEELIAQIEKLPEGTLIVLDDINEFWERAASFKPESFIGIFATINDRNLPCVVTIADGVQGFREFMDSAASDISKGRQKSKDILFLEIKDIQENDEVHLWCTTNFRSSLYSKVIGGYIRELSRHAKANIARIAKNDEAVIFLASYIVLKKYRYQKCSYFAMVKRMYEVIVSGDHIRDVKPSIPDIHDKSIQILFNTGLLRRDLDTDRIYVDDTSLFRSFEDYCTSLGSNHFVLLKYLSGTKESERNQIIRLIEMDGNEPVYYSRAISKCLFPGHVELVGKWLFTKFFEGDPLHIKAAYASDPEKMKEIRFATSLLIGRSDSPITLCRQMIGAGIEPNITIVSELLRSANTHKSPQEKREIIQYALEVKDQFNLPADIYFLQMMEVCDASFSMDRAKEAIDLYYTSATLTEDEKLILEASFQKYCKTLAQKADTSERMNEYFELLSNLPDLLARPKEIKALTSRIKGKRGDASTPLFSQLAQMLTDDSTPTQIEESSRDTGIIFIITFCKNANIALSIYNNAVSAIEKRIQPGDDESQLYHMGIIAKMTYPLAKQMKRLKSDDPIVFDICEVIETRIREAMERNDIGAARKMFNSLLNNQPVDALNDSVDALFNLYNDKTIFPGDRDIDNLNSMFESALRAYPQMNHRVHNRNERRQRCEDMRALAERIEDLRKQDNLPANGIYYMFMFKIIDKIQHTDQSFPTADIRDNMIDSLSVEKNELLLCQEVKLTDSIDVVLHNADKCINEMKRGIIQMNLINHLLAKFCSNFCQKEELKTKLNKLVDGSYKTIRHNIHDYQHYMEFFLTTGQISSLQDMTDFLDQSWTAIQRFGSPLREKRGDILCTAISSTHFDFSETLSLVEFAITYDRNCRIQDQSLFHFDTLSVLANKFKQQVPNIKSDETLKDYLDDIQNIIYTLNEIGYDNAKETMNKVKTPIYNAVKNRIPDFDFIRIPFESDDMSIRHDALLQRIDDNGQGYFSTYELQQFMRQELFEINGKIFQDLRENAAPSPESVRENIEFLMLALESAISNNPDLDMNQINKDLYINKYNEFSQYFCSHKNHFLYYDHFFDGFLNEGYIPEEDRERWKQMKQYYFGS